MLESKLSGLQEQAAAALDLAPDAEALEAVRIDILGRKGQLATLTTEIGKSMGKIPPPERAALGKLMNAVKQDLEARYEARKAAFERNALDQRLNAEWLDLTLPAPGTRPGALHPLTQIQRELEEYFTSVGFAVLDGPEVEDEWHNFDALNIPATHPARDMQDTFFVEDGLVLRTHTSPVQVRAMEKFGAPLRMIAPGRVFRNEEVDACHEHTFYQLEGMMIDQDVSIGHMLYFMKGLLSAIFHRNVTVRLRPGFFPFVEPGFRARYQVPDLRRRGLPGLQAERLGGAAALRAGAPQRAALRRHRPGEVERLRLRPRPYAAGDDALRDRRHPPPCFGRLALPAPVLTPHPANRRSACQGTRPDFEV